MNDYAYQLGENTRNRDFKIPDERLIYKNDFIPPPPSTSSEGSTPLTSLKKEPSITLHTYPKPELKPNTLSISKPEFSKPEFSKQEFSKPEFIVKPISKPVPMTVPMTVPKLVSKEVPMTVLKPMISEYKLGNNRTEGSDIDQIFNLVKRYIRDPIPEQIIRSYIMKYKYLGGTETWNKEKISNLLREVASYSQTPQIEIDTGEWYEDKIKIIVRSDERNIIKYPQSTDFFVPLFPPNGLTKVKEFKLISCIFPKHLNEDNLNINDFPYLILQIKEIGTQFVGKNGKINGFCPLTFETDTGQFKIFHGENSPFTTKSIFPVKNLTGLTISFLLPNGDPFLFKPLGETLTTKKPNITAEISYNPDPFSSEDKSIMNITGDSDGSIDNFPVITLLFEITHLRKRENFTTLY